MRNEETFWGRVEKLDSCWIWLGAQDRHGYGHVAWHDGFILAHRLAYELLVGPIPRGLVIDHLCRVPSCVNPAHLEPVTNRENSQRGERGRMVTECAQGHPYTPDNTYYHNGGRRFCRRCQISRSVAYKRRKRAERVP